MRRCHDRASQVQFCQAPFERQIRKGAAHRTHRPSRARQCRQQRDSAAGSVAQDRADGVRAIAPPEPSFVRDSYASTALAEIIDRSVHATTARFTAGLSPMTADRRLHGLGGAHRVRAGQAGAARREGGEEVDAARSTTRDAVRSSATASPPCIVPLPQDRRFNAAAWQEPPYDFVYQAFLLSQQWWHNAMTGVRGVTKQNENMVAFATRQFLDVFSPSNSLLTNPEVLERTRRDGGNEPRARPAEFRRGRGARDRRPAAGRRRSIRAGTQRRDHAGQGRLPQPADRADPVRAGHRHGAARTGADRPGVDHEVLHPRPLAAEFAGPLSRVARLHGVHDLVEEPRARGSRPVDGGLPRRWA